MTFVGDIITDQARATAHDGDGLDPNDSSIGLWEASTNIYTFDPDNYKWSVEGQLASTMPASDEVKFGHESLRLQCAASEFVGCEFRTEMVRGFL